MTSKIIRILVMASIVVAVSACTQLADAPTPNDGVIVVTAGSEAPTAVGGGTVRVLGNLEKATPSVGGSSTTPVSIAGDGCTAYAPIDLRITYTISGNLGSPATFDINTVWKYNGTQFVGANPVTVNVPSKTGGGDMTHQVAISLQNPDRLGSGTTSVAVAPFNLVTTGNEGQRLNLLGTSTATIHVQFDVCAVENTAPHLTVPANQTVEATSSSGATVEFEVLAGDNEDDDGNLTPTCMVGDTVVTSGDSFPIGETEITCSVTDSGGLSASGSFSIYVQDTLPPVFTVFPMDTTLVATDINGLALDLSAFDIAAKDFGHFGESAGEVSTEVTITCTIGAAPADGFQIAIGQTATVTCVASDSAGYRAPVGDGETAPLAPNVSDPSSFDVTVTLDDSDACGFEPPLRTEAPYSAHKTNSTIPHKFCPPTYADGTPATDLASGLRLVLTMVGSSPDADAIEANDFAAGSTAWRLADGRYIFNLKTARTWAPGQYDTTVSYNGIVLASTEFALPR